MEIPTSRQLKAGRALLGWRLVDLAEKLNTTQSKLSRHENGVTASLTFVAAMAGVMENNGVRFLDNDGVRLVRRKARRASNDDEC